MRAAALLVLATAAAIAQARLIEEQIRVPVRVADTSGTEYEHVIVVTLWHDSRAPRPYPLLVLNHGRSARAVERAGMGRARYSEASAWFATFGFMIAVPTRVGYGVSGGPDVEDSGPCSRKNYPPVYQAAAVQTLKVIEVVRGRSGVAQDRTIVAGQSFGGTAAITLAARNPENVQGGINFAGGGGGRPDTHPHEPCGQPRLAQLFGGYGKTGRMPTLWIYSENDRYFGPTLPRQWYEAFRSAGGTGDFVMYPPHGEDGHGLFVRAPSVWRPRVVEFLDTLGHRPIAGLTR